MPEINYLAVLVCGVASMVLGFVWYGAIFKNVWLRLMGWGEDHVAGPEGKKAANRGYVISFIGSLVMAYILSHVITYASDYTNTEGVTAGLTSGFWMWLGFVAPVTLGSVLWEGKSWKLWGLNNAYYLVQLLVFGAILASWR